jgi:hypothetical protein
MRSLRFAGFCHREKLMMIAMYGGIVIAQERTIGLHAARYHLTAIYGYRTAWPSPAMPHSSE